MAAAGYIEGTVKGTIKLPDFIQSTNIDENETLLLAQEDFVNSLKSLIQGLLKILSQPRVGSEEESG
jgi:hypothetical protein